MRKIHFAIQDAAKKVASGKVDFVRVAPKVTIRKIDKHLVLVYCGRIIASYMLSLSPIYNQIYKGYMWDSPTAVGYYRAFFKTDTIYKECGQVILPRGIDLIDIWDFYKCFGYC